MRRSAAGSGHASRSAAALAGCILACVLWSCAGGPADRDPYLELVLEDPQGRSIRLADFRGSVRVFDIWATWCAPCRVGIPHLNRIYERYRDRGLVVVGVSVDENPAAVVEFAREVPIRYPSGMMNPQADELLGRAEALPTTLLVDRSGRVRRTFFGVVDPETLEAEIQKLL
jgi:thiol-disulfide isomerase/thioredoxin